MDDGRRPRLKQDVSPAGCFLLATWTLHPIWFDVFASIGEAVNQLFPRF